MAGLFVCSGVPNQQEKRGLILLSFFVADVNDSKRNELWKSAIYDLDHLTLKFTSNTLITQQMHNFKHSC